ncbi:Sperm-associated antigen 11 [Pteropus alecto]|uniref:Sperm-associated antigen 11 n=1 Tax=Pteropus alecto TaxID=9402 RepID=L5KH12_PTEAL|nr:Sperm-associated antigen 11 [Pteropus alecto]
MVSVRLYSPQSYLRRKGIGLRSDHSSSHKASAFECLPWLRDMPPGIRNIICQTRHGTCRLFFCHSGEKRGEICSDPWDRCCISNAEEEKKNKPVET